MNSGTEVRDAFRHAIEERSAAALRSLLEKEAVARALLDAPLFSFGAQALNHVAGDERALDVVDVLLSFGADPNRRSDWWAGGFHPLHAARGAGAPRFRGRSFPGDPTQRAFRRSDRAGRRTRPG